jgi:Terminase large subunit, T4likevirus-type, N-terminal
MDTSLMYAMDAASFARDLLGWNPDAKQEAVLMSLARRIILNCSRQWGKTTVAATKVVHIAVTRPGWTVLIVCENLSQTGEFFQKADRFLARLGMSTFAEPGKAIGRRLANGSRIIGIAAREAAVRGYTADFVFIDEAARIDDDVIDAFAPTIAVRRGDWWMASTPHGKRGRFFEAWEYGEGTDLLKVSVPWTENPRIDPGFIAQMRHDKGDAFVRQEFECQFIENGTQLVSLEEVDALKIKRPRP